MASRPLTETEQEFTGTLSQLLTLMAVIQEKAAAVRDSGGDCREAFLSILDDDARAEASMQWPYISLMLGL